MLVVRPPPTITTNTNRYYLASVRGPQVVRGKQDEGWAPHVIEFMRKKLIGKQFKVRLEYKKNISVFGEGAHPPASNEANGDMYFVSLLDANKKNCIIEAVEAGMLKVLANTGGADSMNERSRDFDLLMEAEAVAMAAGKGIHLGEEKAPKMPVRIDSIQSCRCSNRIVRRVEGFCSFKSSLLASSSS